MKLSEILSEKSVNLKIMEICILAELEISGSDNHMVARDLVRFARNCGMEVFAEHLKLRLIDMNVSIDVLNYDHEYEWFTD